MTELSWQPDPAGSNLHINDALRALSEELAQAQQAALGVQDTIHEVVEALGDKPCDAIFKLQRMDYLAQILGDLSAFADKLSASVPGNLGMSKNDATGDLHLKDLAHRLAGDPAPAENGEDGEYFFDPL